MKILLLNYEFPPMGGGAGRATFHIATELTRLGHEVEVLTSRLPGELPRERINGFTVHRVVSFRKSVHDCGFCGAISFVAFAAAQFSRLSRKNSYDIIHYFFSLPTGLLTLLPGGHRKIPRVVSLRGSDVPHYDPFNRGLQLAHRLLLPLSRSIWQRADRVVALSHSLRRTALRTSPNQCIDVVFNGIDAQAFRPVDKLRMPTNRLRLITVARLIERKGIQHVIEALAQTHDRSVTLTVVGTGNYENQLKALCSRHDLQDVVRFYGYCPPDYLPALYHEADVFILPSLKESFGMVFLEAMACGLPIIGGRTGGVPAIVSEENGILVTPGDITAIRRAIDTMVADPETRTQMSQANRRKVVSQFSWRQVARAYVGIYRNIGGNPGLDGTESNAAVPAGVLGQHEIFVTNETP